MMDQPDTDTIIGRRLVRRAVAMVQEPPGAPVANGMLDLTQPAALQPPIHVRDGAKEALDRGETHYTVSAGVPELRQAIAKRSTADGFPTTVDEVVVTNGGSEALYIAFQSVLKQGDRILVGGPVAPNVIDMIRFVGAEPVRLPVDARSRFIPHPDRIAATGGTALLLASPSPVTGAALAPAELEQLIAVAVLQEMTVILDRSLAWCCHNPAITRFSNPDLGARVLTTGSFSTAFDMQGWRVGYFVAPDEHIATMRELKQAMSICTSPFSQFAALAALQGPEGWFNKRRKETARRRDETITALREGGLNVVEPDAWPPLLVDTRLIHPDDREAAAMIARDVRVVVDPASAFDPAASGYVRITLNAAEDTLHEGIERLVNFHNACL